MLQAKQYGMTKGKQGGSRATSKGAASKGATGRACAGRAPRESYVSVVKSIANNLLSSKTKFEKHPKLAKAAIAR